MDTEGLGVEIEELTKDIEEVKANLDEAGEIIYNAAREEIINIIFDLLGEGMRRAPVKEGTLRGSGVAKLNDEQTAHTEEGATATQTQIIKDFEAGRIGLQRMVNELIGEVAFNTPYATVQHEMVEFNHPHGGEAKYLEKPLNEKAEIYTKNLAEAIDRELQKVGR